MPILVNALGIFTITILVQPSKALMPIEATLSGIVIERRLLQPLKVLRSILVREFGRVTDAKPTQFLKA